MREKLLAVIVLLPSIGRADGQSDHVNPVQPVLKLEGSSSGKAQLKIGLDLTFPTDADSDFTFAPLFSTSTNDGVSDVLSFDSNTATARDFTLALQFDSVTLEHLKDTTDSDHKAQVKRFQACVASCKASSTDPFCDAVNIEALNRSVADAATPLNNQDIENLVLKDVSDAATADTIAATKLLEAATKTAAEAAKRVKEADDDVTRLTAVRAAAKQADQAAADAKLDSAKRHLAEVKQQSEQLDAAKKVLEHGLSEAKAVADKAGDSLHDGERKAADLRRKKDRLDERATAAKKFAKGGPLPIDEDTASPDMLCADGFKDAASASKVARDKRLERPHMILSGGLVIGHSSFKFLETNADGLLAPAQDTKNSILFGGTFTYTSNTSPLTFELPVRAGVSNAAADKTAKWCTPVGSVAVAGGMTVPAETCDERGLGAPSTTFVADAALRAGVMSRDVSTFRLALGPTLHLEQRDKQKTSVRAGLSIPLYANTNLLADDKGVFKGVVRITPSFVAQWDREMDKKSYSFLLTIELFTARSMFSTDLTSNL